AGQYVLTSVDHTFDSVKGYVSSISTEPPASRARRDGPIAALGVVTHVDDTVLVLLPSGDPANGVVLGGLYGMKGKDEWDWGVDETAVKRYTLRTPGGQRVRLDDAKQIVRIENSDGSFIEMSPEKVTLHSQRDLQVEAPGRNLVIKANKIDFQRG